MQRFILGKKNHITLLSGILIVIAFISQTKFWKCRSISLVIDYRFHS